MSDEVLFCQVEENNPTGLSAGNWFFDMGHYALCAEAFPSAEGRWKLNIHIDLKRIDKPLPLDATVELSSLEACKEFIADYYQAKVRDVSPNEMPLPDDL